MSRTFGLSDVELAAMRGTTRRMAREGKARGETRAQQFARVVRERVAADRAVTVPAQPATRRLTEDAIIWEGEAVYVTYDETMNDALGPYAVCVAGLTHGVIVGRTADRARAVRVATRLDRYPDNARTFAGLTGVDTRAEE